MKPKTQRELLFRAEAAKSEIFSRGIFTQSAILLWCSHGGLNLHLGDVQLGTARNLGIGWVNWKKQTP